MAAEVTPDVPDDLTSRPLPPDRFADRELSWLAFNQRVLELAEDETVPPLERARFLAIFASNLDEFYMVRVAGLKRRIAAGIAVRAASGLTPRELMKRVHERTAALQARHALRAPAGERAEMPDAPLQQGRRDALLRAADRQPRCLLRAELFRRCQGG